MAWDEIKASFHGLLLKPRDKRSSDNCSENSDCDSDADLRLFKKMSRKDLCHLFYKMEKCAVDAKTNRQIERGKCIFCHYIYKDTRGHYGNFKTHIISQHKQIAIGVLKKHLKDNLKITDWILPHEEFENDNESVDWAQEYEENEQASEPFIDHECDDDYTPSTKTNRKDDSNSQIQTPNSEHTMNKVNHGPIDDIICPIYEHNTNTTDDIKVVHSEQLPLYDRNHPKQLKFTKNIVNNLIINAGMSVSVLDTDGWIQFQNTLDDRLVPINGQDVFNFILPEIEVKINKHVFKLLENVDKVSITCDLWAYKNMRVLLGNIRCCFFYL